MSGINGIDQVMVEMRRLAAAAQDSPVATKAVESSGVDFSDLLKQSIDKVNDTQKAAGSLSSAFSAGDPNVDVTDVMIAAQKSSVAFQAMTEVRNKLVKAYQDIMSMPI